MIQGSAPDDFSFLTSAWRLHSSFPFHPKLQGGADPHSLPSQESPWRNEHPCVCLPRAFLVAPSGDTAPAARSFSPTHEVPVGPFPACGAVCFGRRAREPLFPIIVILSWGVIGTELLVWKFLLRTQSTEWSWEAELGQDSCQRPLGRGGSGFLDGSVASRWMSPSGDVSCFFSSCGPW